MVLSDANTPQFQILHNYSIYFDVEHRMNDIRNHLDLKLLFVLDDC